MEDQELREIAAKKRWLKRYRKKIACIRRLEEKRDLLDKRIKSPRSSNLSGMPRGGVPVTMEDLVADKAELDARILRMRAEAAACKREILAEIDTLDDPRYCTILESFFIDCLSLEDIAEEECYSVRHAYRLYNDAVKSLSVNGQ